MSQTEEEIMSNREFIAAVRAKLDEAGYPEIPVRRQWIREDDPESRFLLMVPVGPDLMVPLKAADGFHELSVQDAGPHIEHFATALINLHAGEGWLEKYAQEVRRTARQEISRARKTGLDVVLESIGFKPVRAYQLSDRSWKEAMQFVFVELGVRVLSFHLQPETVQVWVGEPSEAVETLREALQDQQSRQDRLEELFERGFDLEVDALTVDLLKSHGLDPVQVLRTVWKAQCVNLEVQHLGRRANLSLVTSDGRVESSIALDDAFWNGEHLWFLKEELFTGHDRLVGKSLGGKVQHPVLANRPITKVVRHPAGRDLIFLDLSDKLLFDADTGSIRQDRKDAA